MHICYVYKLYIYDINETDITKIRHEKEGKIVKHIDGYDCNALYLCKCEKTLTI